jgi:hypothetical protein
VKVDGFKYYENILCYVDNVLCISTDPNKSMRRIQEDPKLKDDNIVEPDVYLGATIAKMSLDNGKTCWTMSPLRRTWPSMARGCHPSALHLSLAIMLHGWKRRQS